METTWPRPNINSKREYSREKILCIWWMYYELLNPSHYWSPVSKTIEGERRLLLFQILKNTWLGHVTPPAVLTRYCAVGVLFIPINGTRFVWAALSIIWRYQKLDRFEARLKRWRVLQTRYPNAAWEVGKSSSL